jgi:hypothetical protein
MKKALVVLALVVLACRREAWPPASTIQETPNAFGVRASQNIAPVSLPTPPPAEIELFGRVTADILEVRLGPGEKYNNVGLWLAKGEIIHVFYCRNDGWCKISEGYISRQYVEISRGGE